MTAKYVVHFQIKNTAAAIIIIIIIIMIIIIIIIIIMIIIIIIIIMAHMVHCLIFGKLLNYLTF